ncbi:Retrovirus-related Pol polyprotein from transposon TNT 1-94, partial [Trichinella sp. T9]
MEFKMQNCGIVTVSLQAQLHILIVGKLSAGYTLLIFLVGLSYQNRVGLLTYLVTTSADIASAVSMSSQFIEKSEKQHWMATKRKDSKLWIVFHKRGSCSQNVAINWEARKQNTVALSSTAAEYMELPEASEEAIHLRQLIEETTDESKKRAERPAINPIFHVRTNHIDIRHHFIRDATQESRIVLPTK